MSEFLLNARLLSLEEKIILFGKSLSNVLAIKALDLENYIDLFHSLYSGDSITVPCLGELTGYNRVYIYCDQPVGSRYYAELTNSYNKEYRKEVYNIPLQYVTSRINEFLIPKLNSLFTVINSSLILNEPKEAYNGINGDYASLIETILGGCFLNMEDKKVITISSFPTYKYLLGNIKLHDLQQTTASSYPEDQQRAVWYNLHYNIPLEIGNSLNVKYSPTYEFLHNTSTYFNNIKVTFSDAFNTLFSWCSFNNITQSLVVGPKYLKYNGYFNINNNHYIGFTKNSNSPLATSNISDTRGYLSFTLEKCIFNSPIRDFSGLFTFTEGIGISRYGYNKGSIVFLNKDNIIESNLLLSTATPELVQLDSEFFSNIRQILEDEKTAGNVIITNSESVEKFRKKEFSIKKEEYLSSSEVENSRYISIKNSDGKLFTLTKTSKAKEAARKMAISRKITVLMQPVTDLAIKIFAGSDFELGFKETTKKSNFRFPLTYRRVFEQQTYNTIGSIHLKTSFDCLLQKAVTEYVKFNEKIATSVVSQLYETVNYTDTPFLDWTPSNTNAIHRYSYNSTWHQCRTVEDQEKYILPVMYSWWNYYAKEQNGSYNSNFSSASGQLNIVSLGQSLYLNSEYAEFPTEYKSLQTGGSYRTFTGRHLHFLYTNNFIGDNQTLSDAIESKKTEDWYQVPTSYVAATTAFTFSQEALDTISTLKKCKTLADYNSWFTKVKPTLVSRLQELLESEDYYSFHTMCLVLDQQEDLLSKLAICELPFLPKEEVKQGRKKKEESDTVTLTIEEKEESKSSPEEKAAFLAAFKGDTI